MAGKNGHYEVPRRTARIKFEGTDYDGAEIICRLDMPLQMMFDFERLARLSKAGKEIDPEVLEQTFRRFGDEALESWNLSVGGKPVPATAEGFLAQPPPFAMLIVSKWMETVGDTPDPLVATAPAN